MLGVKRKSSSWSACGATDRTIEIAGEWIYLAPVAAPDTQG